MNEDKNYGPNYLGNVIRIIDERTLIINVGNHELSVGDTIYIYEIGDTLKDLDGSILCSYEHIKDSLEVIEVNENYSVCKKNKELKNDSLSKALSSLALSPMLPTSYEPLKVDKKEIEPLTACDPIIHIGDPVKLA